MDDFVQFFAAISITSVLPNLILLGLRYPARLAPMTCTQLPMQPGSAPLTFLTSSPIETVPEFINCLVCLGR
jgi:hypothetical protein